MLKIDWLENYGNLPRIVVEDDLDFTPREECEFTHIDRIWYHIQDNGIVQYFAHSGGLANEGGYGGAPFTFLHNGEKKTLYGPWSSRASYVNKFLEEPIVDVELRNRSGRLIHTAITLKKLLELWDQEGVYLIQNMSRRGGEPGPIIPSMNPEFVEKPNGMCLDMGDKFKVIHGK